jgi:Domain of unknown function (DUF3859)
MPNRFIAARRLPFAALMFFLLFHPAAFAQQATVTGAKMLWYGIYQAGSSAVIEDKTTATGTRTIAAGITPPQINSDRIPAALNTRFGFGYALTGSPGDAIAGITYVRVFPPAGIVNPKTGERHTSSRTESTFRIDRTDLFIGYLFTDNIELVPGVWLFQVWSGSRKLLEKSFTVYMP